MSQINKRPARGVQQTTLLGWKRDSAGEETSSAIKRRRQPGVTSDQSICHNTDKLHWEDKSLPNGPMLLLRNTIGGTTPSQRHTTKIALSSLPDWNDNVTFQIFGKECRMRRRICQYSSGGNISYSYSGLTNVVAPNFPEVVYQIKCQVEDLVLSYFLDDSAKYSCREKLVVSSEFLDALRLIKEERNKSGKSSEIFNYVLLNHYRNGEEYMSYHTDDESSLHPHYPIASVSLGSTRNFDIRYRMKDDDGKKSRLDRFPLADGDLLLMFPPMQQCYEHGIPVEKRVVGDRINLTFRRVERMSSQILRLL